MATFKQCCGIGCKNFGVDNGKPYCAQTQIQTPDYNDALKRMNVPQLTNIVNKLQQINSTLYDNEIKQLFSAYIAELKKLCAYKIKQLTKVRKGEDTLFARAFGVEKPVIGNIVSAFAAEKNFGGTVLSNIFAKPYTFQRARELAYEAAMATD
jgi:hypothetical protein